jgi:hypothetical protein
MHGEAEASTGQRTIRKTNDGKILLAQRPGLYPLRYDDIGLYDRGLSVEMILWLLTAAGSGIVGNLAYDLLKKLIQDARNLHQELMKSVEQEKRMEREELRKALEQAEQAGAAERIGSRRPPKIEADRSLRDDLVELTYDALARYKNLRRGDPEKLMSEIDVYFTEKSTWAVVTRELRASKSITVEIDLSEDKAQRRYYKRSEAGGFPVGIWL